MAVKIKKVSWLRTLQDIDEAMRDGNLTECEIFVSVVHQAAIDGGYPTMESLEDVAEKFGLTIDFGAGMMDGQLPPPINPTYKVRRIKGREQRER